jgi:predicted MFS family arabinose efflux permease
VASIAIYGVALALLGTSSATPLFIAAAFLGGAAHGSVFPVLSSQVVARARTAERGSAMSIFTSIFDLALLAAAPAVGSMIDTSGYPVAFGVVGALLIVGSFAYGFWDARITVPARA